MTPPLWQKVKRNSKASWWKWKKSEKVGLKLNIQKAKIIASGPITSWEVDGETVETVSDFIFGGSKITADGDAAMKLKDAYSLEAKLELDVEQQTASKSRKEYIKAVYCHHDY